MANNKVLDLTSAMPCRTKIASMTQECVRRLCNTSRELCNTEKCNTLTTFMRKLQILGYSQKVSFNILEGAVRTYRRKVRADMLGIQPIHRLNGFNQSQRRREKILGRSSWFKPSSRGWSKRLDEKEEQMRTEDKGQLKDQDQQHHRSNRPSNDKVLSPNPHSPSHNPRHINTPPYKPPTPPTPQEN